MDFFKPLRRLVPELLDSPSLTRLGQIQRTLLTVLLVILPILYAVCQRFHNPSEFECSVVEFAVVERMASEETTTLCHEEYLKSFPIAYLELFLVLIWLNLLILWLYSSYVSERLELWRTLLKAKERRHKAFELKSNSRVFIAYVSQLCSRIFLNAMFLFFHTWSSTIIAPSRFDCNLTVASYRDTRASCENGHALEAFLVNNSISLLAVLCAFSTLMELNNVVRESERSGRSDYYFCLLLLKENEVPGTRHLIERELFLEDERKRIMAAVERGVEVPFPSFSSPSRIHYIPNNMFIRYEKTKHASSKKGKYLKEEFRSYAKTGMVKLNSLGEIFKPTVKPTAVAPKKILLMGDGGIGKTTLLSEMARKWAEGSGEVNFSFAFFFSCVHLSSLKHELSLRDLLEHSLYSGHLDENVFKYILKHPDSVLLVFDGVDELDAEAVYDRHIKDDISEQGKLPVSHWYLKIAGGYVFPGATVLSTARMFRTLIEEMDDTIRADRKIELHGFKQEDLQEYVGSFFDFDPKLAEEVNALISQNGTLEALCYTPIYCFLTCLCLKHFVQEKEPRFDSQVPSTMTEVCERVLNILLYTRLAPNHINAHEVVGQFSEEMESALHKLSLLALSGIQKNKHVFLQDDLNFVGLDEDQVQLLRKTGFLRYVPAMVTDSAKHVCFNHTVIQEFLAARRIAMEFSLFEFTAFLQKVDERHSLMLQFVAGLCKEDEGDETMMARMIQEFLEAKVRQSPVIGESMIDSASLSLLCACLFENRSKLNSAQVAKNINASHVIYASVEVPVYNLLALFYVLNQVSSIRKLTLQNCDLGDGGFRLLLPSICHKACNLTSLTLHSVGLTDAGMLVLLESAATRKTFSLKVLGLRGNAISCDGARHLACFLLNDWCSLEEVYLGRNLIGHLGVNYLSEALCGESCKVHTLDISSNGLTAKAMGSLSNALSSASCSVKTLYLMQNRLCDQGFGHLCEALASDECRLHVIFVSGNRITDRGIRFLRKALINTSCKLQELYLGYNQVTDEGVKYLVAVLSTHWSYLRVLSLAKNPLSDKGVAMLARALRFNTCNLQRLHITLTRLTADNRGSKLQVRYV